RSLIATLSLHDALPICRRLPSNETSLLQLADQARGERGRDVQALGELADRDASSHPNRQRAREEARPGRPAASGTVADLRRRREDRKSTRLNSSHVKSS